ncbi:uroporphyrinogen decarboxylase family protein [Emticicia sp. TH156]|uniref:uroporphyrinogen decarboxylase family protein n=1 Tax=Emticicia sp. TH156 TaxID=2067454 RepID=UPI000C76402A|nr:uroporphyrinogen decarboxylase family protein [Emticicia sp. TH156]PLK45115.1 hypothetical protein C0V77_07735 [Emticicia sp. TH156]
MQSLVSFWKHHPVADQKAETLAQSTLEFQQKFNCDFIKITPAGSWQAVCHGVEDIWNGDYLGRRIITKTIINNPQDWLRLPDFTQTKPQLLQEIAGACRLVYKKTTIGTPIVSTVFCPVSQAVQMAGLPVLLQHVATNPDVVQAGLERITQNTLYVINELIAAGSKGIYFVTQHMRNGALPPEIYKLFGELYDTQCLNACKDLQFSFFHIHGEDVYFSLSNTPANCYIHYEYSTQTRIDETWKQPLANRLLCGLPASEMALCQTESEMLQLINEKSTGDIVTCGCVLPLDFADDSIRQWMAVAKTIKSL